MSDHSCRRLQNLQNDVEAIIRACAKDHGCPFQEFEYDNFVFKFEYHHKNEKRFYWINLTEDYPDSSSLTCSVNGSVEHYTKRFDMPLPFEFCNLARELYKEMSIPVVTEQSLFPSTYTPKASAESMDVKAEDDYSEEDVLGDDDDYEIDDSYEEILEKNSELKEKIDTDFEMLKAFCDDAKMSAIYGLDTAEILFSISTNSLEDELARAWLLDPKQPVFIQSSFSLMCYTNDLSMVKMEVYQQSTKSGSPEKPEKVVPPVLTQLKSALMNFIRGLDVETLSAINDQIPPKRVKLMSKGKSVGFSGDKSDSKRLPDLGCGFLVELMYYAQQRLSTLNRYCVICDEPHVFGNMLKPMVCARPLCVFSYQTLGVMASVAEAISTEYEVVDLLIKMASAACNSPRCELIFDPFPTIVDPKDSTKLAVSDQHKDFNLVRNAFKKFVAMEEMVAFDPVLLKTNLDKIDLLVYPLLQWIISSNRSHIVKLSRDRQMACMRTPHQFLLRSSAPEKEEAFKSAKNKHGSIYAFHGSPIENWHSIMRKGLINASGSRLQMNGAALGSGIYLSPESTMSFSYSSRHWYSAPSTAAAKTPAKSVPKSKSLQFLPSENILCIALCEVVNSNSLRKGGSIWVMPEEDNVVTRFLFVYENMGALPPAIRSTDPTILSQISKAYKSE